MIMGFARYWSPTPFICMLANKKLLVNIVFFIFSYTPSTYASINEIYKAEIKKSACMRISGSRVQEHIRVGRVCRRHCSRYKQELWRDIAFQ